MRALLFVSLVLLAGCRQKVESFVPGDGSEVVRAVLDSLHARADRGDAQAAVQQVVIETADPQDTTDRVQRLRDLADRGNRHAAALLASTYMTGLRVERDETEAVRWLRRAAALGDSAAAATLRAYEARRDSAGSAGEMPNG